MFYWFSASVFPLFFCNRDAFPLPLQNVLPLQFRHSAEDGQHKFSCGCRCINGLLLGDELNPFGCQLFYQFQQVFGVPGKAADRLHENFLAHRVLLLGADADISYFHGMAPFSCLFQIILVY